MARVCSTVDWSSGSQMSGKTAFRGISIKGLKAVPSISVKRLAAVSLYTHNPVVVQISVWHVNSM